jgi:hypothetical protein
MFCVPALLLANSNLIAKFETFVILNDFSTNSPNTTPPKFSKPYSGSNLTSGLTPFPFSLTDTAVCLQNN